MAKILIVDDDIHSTTLFETVLTMKGHEATSVNDSSLAIETANATTPDLIILDLMMPEPNGFEVCEMLRADSKFANTPIVIFTAMGDNTSKKAAFSAGADDYLTKPFRVKDLLTRIQSLLDKSIQN